jgi:hypothetical protein
MKTHSQQCACPRRIRDNGRRDLTLCGGLEVVRLLFDFLFELAPFCSFAKVVSSRPQDLGFRFKRRAVAEAAKNSFTPLLCAACRISVPSCQALREHERGRPKFEPAGSDERVEWRRHQIASRSSLCVSSRRRTEDGSGDAAGSRRPHVLGAVRRKGKQPPSLST